MSSCRNKIVVKLDTTMSADAFSGCVATYHSELSQRHSDSCPWFGLHSCESLTDPLNIPRTELLKDFESRLQELLKLHVGNGKRVDGIGFGSHGQFRIT